MITAKSIAKTILFGEHAVVYGYPGIAIPLPQFSTQVTVTESEGVSYSADRVLDIDQNEKISQLVELLQDLMKFDDVRFSISTDVPFGAGFGSSASLCVAFVRAIAKHQKKSMTPAEINRIAFECEKIFHGMPSGIDNSVIVYERPVIFSSKPDFFHIGHLSFVAARSDVTGDTKAAVARVKELYESRSDTKEMMQQIGEITKAAKNHLELGNDREIGRLMNENHRLLQKLGVSTPFLDMLCEVARSEGAYGAKLVGGGLGGNMVAVVSKKDREKVADALIALSKEIWVFDT